MAVPFAERAAQTGLYNANGLLNYLKKYYTNPNVSQRALERLRRIRQGNNEPFAAFLPRFERELIKSDGAAWPDYFKISYLKGALNAKITNYLITINPDRQNYPDFIRIIQQTSSHLQAFNSAFLGENRPNYKTNYGVTYGINHRNHGGGNIIQWEPIGSARAAVIRSQKKAKWVSKEKLDARRRERQYLRYGKSRHRKIKCPYLPAQSPRYFNSTPRLFPIPGSPPAGPAGPTGTVSLNVIPLGSHRHAG